ncbi:MAG TPA: DUF721 domain-containing protein [Chlamydiales bacterium]|nr:DUF721 domain-containing protein [Chlamydiales bacterium]
MMNRTPRNFDGTRCPGIKIEEMLPQFLSYLEKRTQVPLEEIAKEWVALLGEKMASLVRVVSFVDGILTVLVKSATFYSLLQMYEKPRLKKKLQEKFQIKDIVFKIG